MKSYILFDIIFNNGLENFIDEIYSIIEDKLEFHCDFSQQYSEERDVQFDKNGEIDIFINITDAEDNGGTCICTFNFNILKTIIIYFMYEDGNEYNKIIYTK